MGETAARVLIAGAVVVLALSVVLFTGGGGARGFINGEAISDLSLLGGGENLRVPLARTAKLLGGRVDPGTGGSFIVEGAGLGSASIAPEDLAVSKGRYFVRLDRLAREMNVEFRREGDKFYLRTERAELEEIKADERELSLRFSRYVPFTRRSEGEGEPSFEFFNVVPRQSSFQSSGLVQGGEFKPQGKSRLSLKVNLSSPADYMVKTDRADGNYTFTLQFKPTEGDSWTAEDWDQSDPSGGGREKGISYGRLRRSLGGRRHTIHYLRASNWRDDYKLEAVLPGGDGVGRKASLGSLVRNNLAVAGLNANFFDPPSGLPIGLLVKDGELLSDDWGGRAALAIDYSGELEFLRPSVELTIRLGGRRVKLDGVNRPARQGELVLYTEGYSREALGNSSGTTVLLLRGSRVYRRCESTLYLPSSEYDYLLVGRGSGRSRLSGLTIGDKVEFAWRMTPHVPMLKDAVSAGPLLIEGGEEVVNVSVENFDPQSGLVQRRAQRSVVATTWDGGLLFLIVRDAGISLLDLPRLLLSSGLGIKSAMALDGGGSCALVYRDGSGFNSIGGGRDIPVGLALVPKGNG